MRILVVGGGCREHIISERLRSEGNSIVSVMRNRNPGIARISSALALREENEVAGTVDFAVENGADFAVIGPEGPLAAGLPDALQKRGIKCFGPTLGAAEIETSKAFARRLMEKYGIPGNPGYAVFEHYADAAGFIDNCAYDVVVKPSGLTGGKGVRIVGEQLGDNADAKIYVKELLGGKGASVVIEERLIGEEFSLQAVTDGRKMVAFPLAQDHKRAFEGDRGPNTGGMGSYTAGNMLLPFVSEADRENAMYITQRVLSALSSEDRMFRGLIYGNFMVTAEGVRLLEFNARFADPEAMNVLSVTEGNLTETLASAAEGNVKNMLNFENVSTVCRYFVPSGYGDKPVSGSEIRIEEEGVRSSGVMLYFGSVNAEGGRLLTTASRSFALLAKGDEPWEAAGKIENASRFVSGPVYSRRDIGTKEEMERKRMIGEKLHGRI
ncbi:MAG: phosphoribosylamine--glycine ligase [Candidatus Thermoplasmatota archaeon]|nr:phosphoribosylamine--glycine ligase [Candidatus Thermoplasmatota archaeon]MCL5253206.1 phosphoribosylamine--glycine ligase [Candidatus Thermoplasmatota archaeon]